MKTLLVTTDYPLPEDRGNRMRSMHFARCFGEYGEVDLMCYRSHVPDTSIPNPFRREFHLEFPPRRDGGNAALSLYDKVVNSKPWIVNNYTDEVVEQVHRVIVREEYDAIVCRYAVNAFPLLSLPEKYRRRVILDIDDLISEELYDVINGEKEGVARLKAYVDKKVLQRYQVKCLEKLGRVVFCSETDRMKMAKYGDGRRMHVVPNIAPDQAIPAAYRRDGHDNRSLLFVGNLSYRPNEMGIVWFINEIFHRLPEELADMRLVVAGKEPGERVRTACSVSRRIDLVENPPDVLPYLEESMAVIVPLLVGGGTRIKILEAGNCCRPVISTPLGAYGLGLNEYEEVLYFGDPRSFAEKLLWLRKRENYARLIAGLKRKIEAAYTERSFKETMRQILCEVGRNTPLLA